MVEKEFNLPSEEMRWSFSPKHTRLRYQAVISALFFWAIALYGVESKGFKLPLGIITFKGQPSSTSFEIGSGLFAFFSLVTFVLNGRIERDELGESKSALYEVSTDLNDKMKVLIEKIDNFDVSQNFDLVQSGVEALKTYCKKVDETVESSKVQISRLRTLQKERAKRFSSFYSNNPVLIALDGNQKLEEKQIAEILKMLSEFDSDTKNNFIQNILKTSQEIDEEIGIAIQSFRYVVGEEWHKVTMVLKREAGGTTRYFLSETVDNAAEGIDKIFLDLSKGVDEVFTSQSRLEKLQDFIDGRRKAGGVKNIEHRIDRDWLGFHIPAIVSFGFFLCGFSHAVLSFCGAL